MQIVKKLGIASVVLIMLMSVMTAVAAGETVVKSESQVVADLGILVGDGNGVTEEYLEKDTTRIQAAIMFLRLKGLEAEAKVFKGAANFSDAELVYVEGQKILAYLKDNPSLGWQGMGNGAFDPLSGITAQQYYKVMLEALGYMQGTDFEYSDVITFAASKGLSDTADVKLFLNMNIATATIEALNATMKAGGKTLAAALADSAIIDASKLEALKYTKLGLNSATGAVSYITDAKGMTLYYFTKDAVDVNSCVAACLTAWPIYYAEKMLVPAELNAADFAAFTRKDGALQSTYKGWPLYYYANDAKAGDQLGDAVNNVWYVIDPAKLGGIAAVAPVEPTPVTPAAKTYKIDISNFAFSDEVLTIEVGSTVIWTNKDKAEHNAEAVNGAFKLPLLAQGESGSFTFTKAGDYDYFCTPHKEHMTAKIIVK